MRLALILTLVLPVAMALKCYAGGTVNEHGVFTVGPCLDTEEYCYTIDITTSSPTKDVHTVTKTCGLGLCTHEGCEPVEGGQKCCCKGDLCNPPAPHN